MDSGRNYYHAEKYASREVEAYAQNVKEDPHMLAFFFPTVNEYLQSVVPGKKVLDVGCGIGNWCYKAAQCGAKSVDGIDIQEEMVQLAKQATSQFSSVNIRVGDATKLPYDDNVFDIALSFFVTVVLKREACISHLKELHRILVPGGKAVVINFTTPSFDKIFLRSGTELGTVENKIEKKLMELPSYPSLDEMNNAFKDLTEVIFAYFTLDKNGRLQRITDINKMTNGQAIWAKTRIMTFPDYFYTEDFIQQQIKAVGLNIDKIENFYTEERRIAYNNTNSKIKFDKTVTETPPFALYHLSKSITSYCL